jgi:hypothetical protein
MQAFAMGGNACTGDISSIVGAMLYRGFQSSMSEETSKYSSTTCFRRDSRSRPHTR